jgi:6-pyruvoyl-tetrahydropterin synthase
MFGAGAAASFHCRHSLPDAGPEEAVPHEHPYRVEWQCWTPGLDDHGYSVDISLLHSSLRRVTSELDGVYLNDLDFFSHRAPTVENVAVFLTARLKGLVAQESGRIELSELRIWEAEDAWASYREQWR